MPKFLIVFSSLDSVYLTAWHIFLTSSPASHGVKVQRSQLKLISLSDDKFWSTKYKLKLSRLSNGNKNYFLLNIFLVDEENLYGNIPAGVEETCPHHGGAALSTAHYSHVGFI